MIRFVYDLDIVLEAIENIDIPDNAKEIQEIDKKSEKIIK